MAYYLGVDTGGTFTDAVLLDHQRRVVASAKRLTTRLDLSVGIGQSLAALPQELMPEVAMVSLSSTLTTNSAVEGKGSPVCVLLIGYDAQQLKASGLPELLGADGIVMLAGGHDAGGKEHTALDEEAARQAILHYRERVSAFAISASFSVRNPCHELRVQELVTSLAGKPVSCGHELASSLGAPRRAMTAALNARMIAQVSQLIESVEGLLARLDIRAPLMIVKGDGSLVNAQSAMRRPISTVLSGPAASVNGACALSGYRDLIVADMGGTTTDIAVVRNGRPQLSFDGARVGEWRPMVEAIRLYSVGLGGDSELSFDSGLGIVIGPRRVVPLSLLASQYPAVIEVLERQLRSSPSSSHNRFALRLQRDDALLRHLSGDEQAAWERLEAGPVAIEQAAMDERWLARALARLERKGLVIYSGFTPTDAAHVLGLSRHWSSEAANLAARIWARRMRRQYGFGSWPEGDAEAPARDVFQRVVQIICAKLVEAGLHDAGQEGDVSRLARVLSELILTPQAREGGGSVFSMHFADELPVVAVGGPAASYYPLAAQALGVHLCLPEHGEVANAVGTVYGEVVQRVHISVLQPVFGVFRVFGRHGPVDHSSLEAALAQARAEAAADAEQMAREAGAESPRIDFELAEKRVRNDIDGELFVEARVTAVASGMPALQLAAEA
ncbi:hydantoinase/oxoprolinase N-terminal domain-containing protein [Pseudomonas sp.]|uniref:hydantoinase/oxoprolinase N-terminal domain-containing protein n=1 Tax=Pseudomonas sp. TaxID=306 RepID=UPI003562365C